MKRLVFCLLVFGFFSACSGKGSQTSGSPSVVLKSLSAAETFSQVLGCYSSGSGKIVNDILSSADVNESDILPVLSFLSGARGWDVVREELRGDRASVELVISDHVDDNRIGSRMICSMKREGRFLEDRHGERTWLP